MKAPQRRSSIRNNPTLAGLVGVYYQAHHELGVELNRIIEAEQLNQPWAASEDLRAFMADIDKRQVKAVNEARGDTAYTVAIRACRGVVLGVTQNDPGTALTAPGLAGNPGRSRHA